MQIYIFVMEDSQTRCTIIIMIDAITHIRSRLDRSVELHANAFWEDDIDSTQVNESEVI